MEFVNKALSKAKPYLEEPPKALLYGLAAYGFYRAASALLEPVCGFWRYVVRGIGDLQAKYGKGSYALVTGASSGLGRALAYQFAKVGFNLVLVARRQQLLEDIKEDIEAKYKVTVIVQAFDLSAGANYARLSTLIERIRGVDISILVNNAGVEQECEFLSTSVEKLQDLINVNLVAPTLLTHLLINQLAGRTARSAVVNISSGLGQTPISGSSIYAATKAYLRFFTYAVGEEMKEKVDFLTVNLGYTRTPMINYHKDLFTAEPEDSAYGVLRDLGLRETDTTFRQYYCYYLLSFLPFSGRMWLVNTLHKLTFRNH